MSVRLLWKLSDVQLHEDYTVKRLHIRDIAKKYGVSVGAVHYNLVKHGIPRRSDGRPRLLTPAQRDRIIALRKAGYGILHIADETRVGRNTVWRVLQAADMVNLARRKPYKRPYPYAEPMVG